MIGAALAAVLAVGQATAQGRGTADGFARPAVVLFTPVWFDPGSASITAQGKGLLGDFVARMRRTPPKRLTVYVDGQDDGKEATGAKRAAAIAERRAQAVAAYLVRLGVPAASIRAHGWGSRFRTAPAGDLMNRRVEVTAILAEQDADQP